jgi:hypothetical protein
LLGYNFFVPTHCEWATLDLSKEFIVNHLFLHCRAGFEKECSAEITDAAANMGIYGYCKTHKVM